MRLRFNQCIIVTLAMSTLVEALDYKTDPPIRAGNHFAFMWNAPTELCESRFNLPLNLIYFDYITSPLRTAVNQTLSMFYIDRFGIHPRIELHKNLSIAHIIHGGLPQVINMTEHLLLAASDIDNYIPPNHAGLAVLDFEEWRPQWIRNWRPKDVYRRLSIEYVYKRYSSLSEREATEIAKAEFDQAAKTYFIDSIRLGKRLRPDRLWGYYLFPDCYNYQYKNPKNFESYTGECLDLEKLRNDNLKWLWNESTAIYPSIYLELVLKDTIQARLYVRNRLEEAMRSSVLAERNLSIPVYAFIRPVYKDFTDTYMSEFDLVNTIGEAASLGVAGVVSWGDMNVARSEGSCNDARRYLNEILNAYILNVSTAVQICSESICQNQGRCSRKIWDSDTYLHLNKTEYQIHRGPTNDTWVVSGKLTQFYIDWFDSNFDCMCYTKKPCRLIATASGRSLVANRSILLLMMLTLYVVLFH